MKCPYCGHPDTRVIDSRPAEDNNAIEEEDPAMNAGNASQPMKSRDDSPDRDQKRQ